MTIGPSKRLRPLGARRRSNGEMVMCKARPLLQASWPFWPGDGLELHVLLLSAFETGRGPAGASDPQALEARPRVRRDVETADCFSGVDCRPDPQCLQRRPPDSGGLQHHQRVQMTAARLHSLGRTHRTKQVAHTPMEIRGLCLSYRRQRQTCTSSLAAMVARGCARPCGASPRVGGLVRTAPPSYLTF